MTENKILMVTKPLAPPWHDSGKNIPRDVVRFSKEFRYRVFTPRAVQSFHERADAAAIYPRPGDFSPPMANQIRLLMQLLKRDRSIRVFHYFFTPNPKTSMIGSVVNRIKRKIPSIQTISSEPASYHNIGKLIFSDRVVSGSKMVQSRLSKALNREVDLVYPGIPVEEFPRLSNRRNVRAEHGIEDRFTVLYPGDFVFSKVTDILKIAVTQWVKTHPDMTVILACRTKTAEDRDAAEDLKSHFRPLGGAVRFLGEVENMTALLQAVDLVIFPVKSLYAKMDIPLVLLEAMAVGAPVLVSDLPSLREMITSDEGLIVPAGDAEILIRTVSEIYKNSERLELLTAAAGKRVRRDFHAAVMASNYERIYHEMVKA